LQLPAQHVNYNYSLYCTGVRGLPDDTGLQRQSSLYARNNGTLDPTVPFIALLAAGWPGGRE